MLQELRVLLPGAQVLVAFLFTAPFSARFAEVDELGRATFGVALMAGVLAIVAFATPIAFHRYGQRTERSERLHWGIRTTRIGLGLVAASLVSAVFVVMRLVFGPAAGWWTGATLVATISLAWLALPATHRTGPTGQAPRRLAR